MKAKISRQATRIIDQQPAAWRACPKTVRIRTVGVRMRTPTKTANLSLLGFYAFFGIGRLVVV